VRLKLEDIGRMAGVSRATVSRVVNGEQNVRPEVRERVENVIRRTGYTPNAAARSLVSKRTGVIGLVIPSRVHNLFEDPYFAQLIQGVTLASNRFGTTLSLFLFQSEAEERELYPRVVESGFLDGIIITATRMGDPLVARMTARGIPLVMIGRPDVDDISYVDVDNRAGATEAARHLVDIGRRRIGLIGAPTNTTAGRDRLDGFLAGLADRGQPFDTQLRADGDFSESSGYEAMRLLIDRDVDGVFVASDTMAFGALRAVREFDLEVPDDVAMVGFDGFTASQNSVPPLTTIRQPVADTAARAVEILIGLISGELTAPTSSVLPVELVVRATTGAHLQSPQPTITEVG
jgi:DNA-binding LacI/PurR family transcriptional regulator